MSDAKKEEAKPEDPKVKVIYLTVFLDFFASGIVLPLLQTHAKGELGADGYNVGMVFTAYSAASIVGSFILGRLSDTIGRRPIILISLLMSSVTLYMTAVATTLTALIQTRALAGFFSETSVCQAYIADRTTLEDRPRYLGHMGAFIGLGFMVGPAMGAVIGSFGGLPLAGYFTTVVTFFNFIYAMLKMEESLGKKSEEEQSAGVSWGSYFKTLMKPSMLLVLISQFAGTFAFMGWNTTFGNWAAERLGYQPRHVGLAFAWLSFALILAMWKARARVKNGPQLLTTAAVAGNLMMCVSLLCHRWMYSTWTIFVPLFLLGFGYGLSELAYQTITSVSSGKDLQGSMLGTLSSITALARALSPVVTGYLFDYQPGDLNYAYTTLAMAPLFAALVAPLTYKTDHKKKE